MSPRRFHGTRTRAWQWPSSCGRARMARQKFGRAGGRHTPTAGTECMLADGRRLASRCSMGNRHCEHCSSPFVIFLTCQTQTTFRTCGSWARSQRTSTWWWRPLPTSMHASIRTSVKRSVQSAKMSRRSSCPVPLNALTPPSFESTKSVCMLVCTRTITE